MKIKKINQLAACILGIVISSMILDVRTIHASSSSPSPFLPGTNRQMTIPEQYSIGEGRVFEPFRLPGNIIANPSSTSADHTPYGGSNYQFDASDILLSSVSVGGAHTCALTETGAVKCWGYNNYGQLGNNSTDNSLTPVSVVGLNEPVAAIAAGGGHTCALTVAGGVKCWGRNVHGQLGNNSTTDSLTPVQVYGLQSDVQAIAAGSEHTCALKKKNQGTNVVLCWGSNNDGQLGDYTYSDRKIPTGVYGLSSGAAGSSAKTIAAGSSHSCAGMDGGGIKCWGLNVGLQLGSVTQSNHENTPVDVDNFLEEASSIALGMQHSCAVTVGGDVKCWGVYDWGSVPSVQFPTIVDGFTDDVVELSAGSTHTCALTAVGGVKCWGWNNGHGELGDGTTEESLLSPVDVVGLSTGVSHIASGGSSSCGTLNSGGMACWGSNNFGQLGDGTTDERHTPVSVIGLENKKWTVMAYLDGDNNLESWSVKIVEFMGNVGSTDDVNLIAQLDRIHMGVDDSSDDYDDWETTKRFYIEPGTIPDLAHQLEDLGEANMGDGQTLQDFIQWGMINYPAEHYALIIQDHGNGWITDVAITPENMNNIAFDDTPPGDSLDVGELRNVLKTVTNNGLRPIDILGMDACLMGGIEVDLQLKDFVKYRIASEDIAYTYDWDYVGMLAELTATPDMSADIFVRKIFNHVSGDTWSVTDLGAASDELIPAMSSFASVLLSKGYPYMEQIWEIRQEVQHFGYYRPPNDDISSYRPSFIDLFHFASLVKARIDHTDIRTSAGQVISALDQAILLDKSDPSNWPYAFGMSVYFPQFEDYYMGYYDGPYGLRFTDQTAWDDWIHYYYGTFSSPVAFGKIEPYDTSSKPTNPTLSWTASSGAVDYEYCYDTNDDGQCTGDSIWHSTGSKTSASLSGLEEDTTYYWQVRALGKGEYEYADGGAWWSFTTFPGEPEAFAKTSPENAAIIPANPLLSWNRSENAVAYFYCIDTIENDTCDTSWHLIGAQRSAKVNLTPYTTYYWQVRAFNNHGTIYADNNSWWSFYTTPIPATFEKTAPASVTTLSTNPNLTWDPSAGATGYEYCIDTDDDDVCDSGWVSTGTDTEAGLSGLTPMKSYSWQVRALNDNGSMEANDGEWWEFTTVPPPDAFAKLSPEDGLPEGIGAQIAWEASLNAESYEYCYDETDDGACDGSWISAGEETGAALTGLTEETTYYWQARAVNGAGTVEADGGDWWSFTFSPAPAAFAKNYPDEGGEVFPDAILAWDASDNAESYAYCFDETDDDVCDGTWIPVGEETVAEPAGLAEETTYFWQVRAVNSYGTVYADDGAWSSFTTLIPASAAFGKITPADGSDVPAEPSLAWASSAGAEDYEYCYDTDDNGICDTDWISSSGTTGADLSGLSPDTEYFWQVRAVNTSGETYADSSEWWSFTTYPEPPGAFGKTAPADESGATNEPVLSWSAAAGTVDVYEYCIDTSDDDACDGEWISAGTETAAAISGLNAETAYYWQVRAVNLGGTTEGDVGAWWSFTTGTPPGDFVKFEPEEGAVTELDVVLFWDDSDGAEDYEYCYDTIDNDLCDTEWIANGDTIPDIDIYGLDSDTTYYWQIRAVNQGGYTYADGGIWWSFTTVSLPDAFVKLEPADGSYAVTDPSLSWEISGGAMDYEYCLDTVDNDSCDSSWISTGGLSGADITGLDNNVTYFWQVRAVNGDGTTYADGGTWWSFTALPVSFSDVPSTYWAWPFIERLYDAGITGGCGGGNFCPANSVTRAEMAIFLERGIHGSSYSPPVASGTVFGDVPVSHWAAAWIEGLSADGITAGCGGGNYCPNDPVTRAEMAIFLLRSKYGSSYTPPAATGTVFGDIPVSYWAAAWIEQLAAEGITSGCGGGNYCPNSPVTRAEMAIFLVRTFELP